MRKTVVFLRDLPHATTISRALQVCDTDSLLEAITTWQRQVFGLVPSGQCASMDGKTMRGVHGKEVVRHIFSLVSHQIQRVLAQVGVNVKENEISACPRLLAQAEIDLPGLIITADALLTQKKIAQDIRSRQADYLLMVKDNQRELKEILQIGFTDPAFKKQVYRDWDYTHGREIETTVEITRDFDLEELGKDWKDIAWGGKITRRGKRPVKTQTRKGIKIIMKSFSEETCFISSVEDLTAKQAAKIIRGHWSIENNLHWQKDWTYLEDRQTLRKGKAPQVMTLLKSLSINLFHQLDISKISETLRSFTMEPKLHQAFLRKAWTFT